MRLVREDVFRTEENNGGKNGTANPFYSSGAADAVTCVVREKRICGYLENARFEKPVSFQGLDDMVLRIDDMCNLTQFSRLQAPRPGI